MSREFVSNEGEIFTGHPKGRHDLFGREFPDPTPMSPPVGYVKQDSLAEQIRRVVRSEKLAMEAEAAGYETFDEADDFDIEDDPLPMSPYEMLDGYVSVRELRKREREAAEAAASPPPEPNTKTKSGDQPDTVTEPAQQAKSGKQPKAAQHANTPSDGS